MRNKLARIFWRVKKNKKKRLLKCGSATERKKKKKNLPTVEEIPAGLLAPVARGRMNELICSHCASRVYSHTRCSDILHQWAIAS